MIPIKQLSLNSSYFCNLSNSYNMGIEIDKCLKQNIWSRVNWCNYAHALVNNSFEVDVLDISRDALFRFEKFILQIQIFL